MDPFQQSSRSSHAFRVVPMTHLSRSAESGRSTLLKDTSLAAPQTASANVFRYDSNTLNSGDLRTSTEADSGSISSVDNVHKWQQFGLRVVPPALPPHASPAPYHCHTEEVEVGELRSTAAKSFNVSSTRVKELAVVERVKRGDDGSHRTPSPPSAPHVQSRPRRSLHALSALHDRLPCSPTPVASKPPVEVSSLATAAAASIDNRKDIGSTDAVRRLQLNLAQLSEKVQHSAEVQRCGPPKRNGGREGSRKGKSSWVSKKWGIKTSNKKVTDEADPRDNDYIDEAANENFSTTAPNENQKIDAGESRKGMKARKRGRAAATNNDNGVSVDGQVGKGGKRKRATAGKDSSGSSSSGPRTLFVFSSNRGGDVDRALTGLEAPPTAAATVSVPFFFLQCSTEDLFNDVRRTLNDPDRIQAPPLFVGISTLANDGGGAAPLVECRTNFTYHNSASKTVKGRASSCFASVDPVYSHHHVELVMTRWKDAVYALPAQTIGFPFLCRVLNELPGVEVITYNAQAVLVALLAHCKGTLWSHCISDVRVMAWMAQLHIGCSPSAPPHRALSAALPAGTTAVADGGADADMNVLYDYNQLLLRVSAGRPPPSVMLEKANESDSGVRGAVCAVDAPVPPLTPAQRLLAQQVYYLATVYRSLYGLLGSKGLLQAFLRQEKRIALLLALMRYNGIGVDLREVHRYHKACEAEMTRQRNLAVALVPEMGDDFNLQSHDHCRRALYEILQLGKFLTAKLPGGGEAAAGSGLTITKAGRLSTAEDTLRALAPHHDFPACLLKYRKASKLMQAYVEGMMGYAIVRAETSTGSTGASGVAATAESCPRGRLPSTERSATQAEPLLLGLSVSVEDTSSPFVDRQLSAGAKVNTYAVGAGGRFTRAASSPGSATSRLSADEEEASVTAVSDLLTLPARGYATIHPNFLQEGTSTGRLSCVEPNLQNLPRNGATSMSAAAATTATATDVEVADGNEGEEDLLGFRRCFVAPAGSMLLSVDYQQIELRVLAHLCGDNTLIAALTTSTDIHRSIAEIVFKKRPVSPEERTLAKRVVFGMLYGAGPKTLAAHMGVSVERALHITSLLTNSFPGIETYHRRVVEESRVNGFVRTISGRLRYLPDIQSTVMSRRSYAERQAFNSVVQGSAADVMKMAMVAVAKEVLQQYSHDDVSLLSQIHDEMVFTVRTELLSTLVPLISCAMSHAMHLLVPLSVTVKFGHSLGELEEWSVEHDLGLGVDG